MNPIQLKIHAMKRKLMFTLSISLLLFGLVNCKKTNEITCNLSASSTQPPVEMDILYTASQTGDGTISSLSYVTISGTVTVQNPTLPWSVTVPALTTTKVAISASGNVKNGSLKITYDGSTGSATIRGSDFCEQQTN